MKKKIKTDLIILTVLIVLFLCGFGILYVITRPDAPVLPSEELFSVTADLSGTDCREVKFESARFSVPESWKVREETGGLVLLPPGTDGNGARLEYDPEGDFAVCGTGLREEPYTLMCGVNAAVGTYDDSDNWSFIRTDNGYVMLNEGLSGASAETAKAVFFNMRLQPDGTKVYDVSALSPELAWVGWSEDGFRSMVPLAKKNRYYPMSSRQGLPTAVITNAAELEAFKEKAGEYFQLDARFNNENGGYRSFSEITEQCDEKFFENSALLVTLIQENTGSASHTLENAGLTENGLEMYIKTDVPEVGTCDMAGWFLCTVFPAEDVTGLEYVNAWR